MLARRVPPGSVRAVHVGDDPEVVYEVRLPEEADGEGEVVPEVAQAIQRGASDEVSPRDEEEGVELDDAVAARLDGVLGETQRVEQDGEGEDVVQDERPGVLGDRAGGDDDPHRVDDDVGDEDLRDKLRAKGFKNIKRFSWEKSANQIISIIEGFK